MGFETKEFKNLGMDKDSSISKSSGEYAFHNHNIRISSVDDSTVLSVTSEQGCIELKGSVLKYLSSDKSNSVDTTITGEYVGHCDTGKYLILFTNDNGKNYIYKLEYNLDLEDFEGHELYSGNLGITKENPIETLFYYESEDIQKVYFVDGVNPNRCINIQKVYITDSTSIFDFNPEISKFPTIEVETEYNGLGRFYSGVIQYYVTYYNKYGAETGIVAQSPLKYIKPASRGGKAGETCDCNFKIILTNLDTSFDYVRVYSAQRSSIDGPIETHLIKDIKTSDKIELLDSNTDAQLVDSSLLYFLGGNDFKATTLCCKNDTLFLGNLEITGNDFSSELKQEISNKFISKYSSAGIKECQYISVYTENFGDVLDVTKDRKTFKSGEIYRFAIQFQNKRGVWTSPVWIGDVKIDKRPENVIDNLNGFKFKIPTCKCIIPEAIKSKIGDDFINYRILRAETHYNNRSTIAQGIVCPTMFNYGERYSNSPFSIASWMIRPDNGDVPYEHMEGLDPYGEIQSLTNYSNPPVVETSISDVDLYISFILHTTDGSNRKLDFLMFEVPKGKSVTSVNPGDVKKVLLSSYDITSYNADVIYNSINTILKNKGYNLGDHISEYDFYYFLSNEAFDDVNFNGWVGTGFSSPYSAKFPWTLLDKGTNLLTGTYKKIDNYEITNNGQFFPSKDVENKKELYFVDSNILTFHCPNINSIQDIVDNKSLKFRIVGYAKVENTITDSIIQTSSVGLNSESKILQPKQTGHSLVSDFLYKDLAFKENTDNSYSSTKEDTYRVHLWNKTGSLSGWIANKEITIDGNKINLTSAPSKLKHKIFANYRVATKVKYIQNFLNYDTVNTQVFNSDELTIKALQVDDKTLYYYGNYDKVLVSNKFKVTTEESSEVGPDQNESIRIKYKSTPHIVFGLPNNKILPYRRGDKPFSLSNVYPNFEGIDNIPYPWELNDSKSYEYSNKGFEVPDGNGYGAIIYIGELYRDIPYESLYGGYDENALELISWVPASDIKPLSGQNSVAYLYGDTYFNSWECLKTYPYTEEDENSIVDITKVLLESFENLQGRSDINSGTNNILNARPTNFNLFNSVYNQDDNVFKYNILDSKFDTSKFNNQVTWSLTKSPTEDIDSWTNISLTSLLNLDGNYGGINKLFNINGSIVAFQDKAISSIHYDERTQLSTESGTPVEIQNSGKVTGYDYITTINGCKNKSSIVNTKSGVYFIDDNTKTFNKFSKEGIVDISANGMSSWFKKYDISTFKTLYDSITNDIYLVDGSTCLVYNEILNRFTSFMDYQSSKALLNYHGRSFLIDYDCGIHEMFKGGYKESSFGYPFNYYMEYKVNPEAYIDKTFTNIEFIADVIDSECSVNEPVVLEDNIPFDKFEIWNEYQYGETDLSKSLQGPLAKKFRIWRIQTPRDSNSKYKNDRIRSPWAHMKLSFNNDVNKEGQKMVFHNLIVKYFK